MPIPFRPVLVALSLTIALAGVSSAQPAPYVLDVILPLTGSQAFAGSNEQAGLRAYETVVNRGGGIHGRPLQFDVHDDQSNPLVDVQIVNALLPKHPIAILGPAVTATCSAIMPLFANGPVNYCFSPAITPPRGSYVFASGTTLQAQMIAGYQHFRTLGYKRLAAIIATDATGQQNEKITRLAMTLPALRGMELVDLEEFNIADTSVAALVSKVRAANPDLIYVWAIGPALGTVLRELANAGLDVPVGTTPANANTEMLNQFQSFIPKALVTSGLPYQGTTQAPGVQAASNEYLQALKEAHVQPSTIQAYAWDPARIVVSALRTLPATATAADLRAYLANLHGFGGLFGTYDLRSGDQHGLDGRDSQLIYWDPANKEWKFFAMRAGKA
jgi:branched-chain amino acid transport system substrate-binding protein